MTLINRTWHISIFSYPPACIHIVIGRYCQKSLLIIALGKSQYFIIPSLKTSWFGWDCQKRLIIELGTSQYFLIPCLCQVRLIGDPDRTYQFKHVYRLGIRKHWDVPRTIDNRSHIKLFQHVCRERIRKYLDVPIAVKKRSWQCLPILSYLQARDKTVLRCAKFMYD